MKTVALSGSTAFAKRMQAIAQELEILNFAVLTPEFGASSAFKTAQDSGDRQALIELQHNLMEAHIKRIQQCDAQLIINDTKNGVLGYMGTNTFIELGIAWALRKPLYLLYVLPTDSPYYDEVYAVKPVVLNGNLKKLIDIEGESI